MAYTPVKLIWINFSLNCEVGLKQSLFAVFFGKQVPTCCYCLSGIPRDRRERETRRERERETKRERERVREREREKHRDRERKRDLDRIGEKLI